MPITTPKVNKLIFGGVIKKSTFSLSNGHSLGLFRCNKTREFLFYETVDNHSVIDYRAWGTIGLIVTFLWQLYTLWILVNVHESPETGMRYSRYLQLSTFTFGMNSNLIHHLFDKLPQPKKKKSTNIH